MGGGQAPPGTERPRGRRPRLHYELIGCGLRGHQLIGTDAAEIRPVDALLVRDGKDGFRWYRCVRCDAWVPLPPPAAPTRQHLPERSEITLPLRGRPLRDRYVLRLIALDRLVHFLVLGTLAVAVFLFTANQDALRGTFFQILGVVQGSVGGPNGCNGGNNVKGFLGWLERAVCADPSHLWFAGWALTGYAVLEGVEAVGLWLTKRWAEYLTFVATTVLLIPEVYELTVRITPTKVITLLINLAVVGYLLVAKRLFGVRGGGRVETAERARDIGWPALERTLPGR